MPRGRKYPQELIDRLLLKDFQQRPAGALDPLPGGGVGAFVGLPFVAADLVNRSLTETHHVEGVKADLGVGDVLPDRLLVAAGHVDRDRRIEVLRSPSAIEEALQGLSVAAGLSTTDRAGVVVDDGREVAVMAAIADLVHADRDKAGQPTGIEVIGDDPREDLPD